MNVGEAELSRTLEVRKDPNSEGTVEDIRAQNELLFEVRALQEDQNEMIDVLEWVRKQIEDRKTMTKKDSIVEAADELYQRALDVEDNFFQLTQTGRGDDGLRAPGGLGFSRLSAHVGSADFAPTEQASEVYEELAQTMKTYRSLFEEMMESELARFNTIMEEENLPRIVIPPR